MSAEEKSTKVADKVAGAVVKYSDYVLLAFGIFGIIFMAWLIWRYAKVKEKTAQKT